MAGLWHGVKGLFFGNRGKDYAGFENDGTLVFGGNATVWDDISESIIGRALSSTAGTIDQDWSEGVVVMQANGGITDDNDCIISNIQFKHGMKMSTLRPHIHIAVPSDSNFEFTVRYRKQSNFTTWNDDWVEKTYDMSDAVQQYTGTGYYITIIPFDHIDVSDMGLSHFMQFRFTRSDSFTGEEVWLVFGDAHWERDQIGSREEFIK